MVQRGLFQALCATTAIVSTAVPLEAAAAQATANFKLPAQALDKSLRAVAQATRSNIAFNPDDLVGKQAPPLNGAHSAASAVERLLVGSGLTARSTGTGSIVVTAARGPRENADAGELPANAEEIERSSGEDSRAAGEAGSSSGAEIVVTGTHIRGVNPTSPLHVVSREDIEQSGYGTVGEVIRSLPENFNGGQNPGNLAAGAVNNNTANGSTANLRGLGSDATLVLVNGRRLAADGIGQAADISMIPLSAIERVEVVTDGSSAVYGADAVAGVVNFILRKNFEGFEGSVRVGGATQGGGFEQTYSAIAGLAGERGHIFLNLQHSKQDEILASDRDFASAAVQDTDLFRPQTQTSALLSGSYDIGDRVTVSLDALWSDLDSSFRQQQFPSSLRFVSTTDSRAYSVTGGVEVDLSEDWDARLSLGKSAGTIDFVTRFGTSLSHSRYRNEISYGEIVTNGPLLRLPGGDLRVAIGVGGRKLSFRNDSRTSTRLASGSDDVLYLFGEALLPVVRPSDERGGLNALELSLSGRFERYSDFGSTTTPRFGVRYVPLPGVTVRGTWGKSFKTPSFAQYAGSRSVVVFQATVHGHSGPGLDLLAQGSNPDLVPEKSTSWTAGIEYSPPGEPSLKLGATYFNVDYRDRVVMPVVPVTTAFSNPLYESFLLRNPSADFQAQLIANSNVFANLSGTTYDPANVVAVILNQNTNATSQSVHGVDVSYRQSFDLGHGQINTFGNATWVILDQKTIPTFPVVRRSGTLFNVPDFRLRAGLTWRIGNFAATGAVNHSSASMDTGVVPNRRISPWTIVDLNVSYEFPSAGVAMALSVQNLFDRSPPYVESPGRVQQGITWDTTNTSAIGRFVAFTIRKRI